VVDVGVLNALHAALDHELRALEPLVPLGEVADRLWPSDAEEATQETADRFGRVFKVPRTPVDWERWGGLSGLATVGSARGMHDASIPLKHTLQIALHCW